MDAVNLDGMDAGELREHANEYAAAQAETHWNGADVDNVLHFVSVCKRIADLTDANWINVGAEILGDVRMTIGEWNDDQ